MELFSLFKKTITQPIFIKEFEKESEQLKDLIELSNKVVSNKKEFIDRDIAYLKYGLEGENNIYFELKNSFIPMLCLHDIRLEYNDYVAQLDFVVITNRFILILETKKLNGDIEITKDGDFIRYFKNYAGKIIKKEGMYSPISQNERHVAILKEILIKEGIIKKLPVKSAVIIANPKTIINKKWCPRAIQNSIYKYDQIKNLINRELENCKKDDVSCLEKHMYSIANYLIQNNKPITFDYLSKYSLVDEDFRRDENKTKASNEKQESHSIENVTIESLEDTPVYKALREYRFNTSKREGIKPYFIYNNEEMEQIIRNNPQSKEELIKIKGFGEKKIEKYGDSIIWILKEKSPLVID